MFRKIIISSLIISAAFVACNQSDEKEVVQSDVGGTAFRNGDLMDEDVDLGQMAQYSQEAPGTSTRFDRAFENAPPMIPHNIETFPPITVSNNMCLSCHMPAVAVGVKSTPIPASHFTNYRPEIKMVGGKYQADKGDAISAHYTADKLNSARYVCTSCHVPQSNATVVLKNIFTAEYRVEKSKTESNLNEVISEGVKK